MTRAPQPSGVREAGDACRDGRITRRQFVEVALKLGVSVTGAAGLLAACHPQAHPAAAPARLSGRVQLLVGFDGGNTAAQRQVQQALAQAFIAAHPQVGIDFLRANTTTAAEAQLRALIARGSPPDVVLGIGLADLSRFADQHTWLDLHPFFTRDGVSTGAFAAPAMSAAALPTYYASTKAIAGVPLTVHGHALAYNVDRFSKSGLSAPPTSWTDNSWAFPGSFLEAAQALTTDGAGNHAGQPGFDPSGVASFGAGRIPPEALFYGFGGHIYNASKRRAEFDSEAAIRGAQFAADLVNRYHVQPPPTGFDELAAWRAGHLAMIDLCSCEINSPLAAGLPFPWKAAALPTGPARRFNRLEVSLGAVVAASAQRELAWEVLKFFAVAPNNEVALAVDGFGGVPALTANGGAFAAMTEPTTGVDPAVWIAGLPVATTENDGWVPAFGDVHRLFSAALAQITAGASAAIVMPQLQQQAQAGIDAWFKANRLPK